MFKKPAGQSLLEVIIALGIFMIGTLAAGALLLTQFWSTETHRASLDALLEAESGLESVRAIRNNDWFALRPGTFTISTVNNILTLVPASPPPATGNFITITEIDDTTVEVVSSMRTAIRGGQVRTLTASTRFTDWQFVDNDAPVGDWSNPTVQSPSLPTEGGGTGVFVRRRIAYLSVGSGGSDEYPEPDFYTIDVANPAAPTVLGSITFSNNNHGTDDVAVYGDYAYLASRDENTALYIVNITNPASPTLVSSFTLPGFDEAAKTVAVRYPYVYLGTYDEGGSGINDREFWVINVSNPGAPTLTTSLEFDGDINDIVLDGNYAYVAANGDYHELAVLNIANPGSPAVIESFNAPASGTGYGISPIPDRNLAALVRYEGNPEFMMLNTTNITSIAQLGSARSPEHFHKVLAADPYVFATGTHNSQELVFYDVTNPGAPLQIATRDLYADSEGVFWERNVLYVAVRNDSRPLAIITAP